MKLSFFIFLSLIIISIYTEEEFQIDNNILVLTDNTFDKALEKYEHILVMFYAPWCGHCKKFKPKLEKAAEILAKENLFIAKVDATVERELHKRFKINGYPKVYFFKNGIQSDYTGERTEQDVINWMRKKSRPPTIILKKSEEIEKFQKDNNVSLIYFGKDNEELKIIENISLKFEDFPFGVVEDEEIAKEFNAKQRSVVLYKKFDEKRNDLTIVKEKELIEFIEKNSKRKVGTFDDKTIDNVFGNNQPAIAYFGEKGDKWNEAEKLMETIAVRVDPKLKVIMTEIKERMGKRVAEYIGIKTEDLPLVIILDTRIDLKKYIFEGDINEKNIIDFIEGWEKGKLKVYLKSQEEPKENKENIFVIVGKTFKKEVIENDKDVMLVFYSPRCGHCQQLLPHYEEAAKKLKARNPKIILAKMDSTQNEIESLFISSYPTIKFYPGNKKNLEPMDYNGERTAEGIIKFLQINAYNKVILNEDKKEEKSTEL